MGRVQTPKQANLVPKVVVDEMPKLPDDIAVDKPVPGQGGLNGRIFFKQADTKNDHAQWNESSDKSIGHINQEINFVDLSLGLLMGQAQDKFKNKQQRDNGNNKGTYAVLGGEGTEFTCL